MTDTVLDEEKFNLEIRKFLKVVGVTSQREIELAIRDAVGAGRLGPGSAVAAKVTLSLPELDLEHVITGELKLS